MPHGLNLGGGNPKHYGIPGVPLTVELPGGAADLLRCRPAHGLELTSNSNFPIPTAA